MGSAIVDRRMAMCQEKRSAYTGCEVAWKIPSQSLIETTMNKILHLKTKHLKFDSKY